MTLNAIKQFFSSPTIKRLAISIPLTVAVVVLLSWFDVQSAIVSILTGVCSYICVDWLMCTTQGRKSRIAMLRDLLNDNGAAIAGYSLCVAVFSLFYFSRTEPSEPAVQQLLRVVEQFGVIAICIIAAVMPVINTVISGSLHPLSDAGSRLAWGLVGYSVSVWLIGNIGDSVYLWGAANPRDAAISAIAAMIIIAVVRLADSLRPRAQVQHARALASTARAASITSPDPSQKATSRDRRYTAAHEAGHALLYAALDRLPDGFVAEVPDGPKLNGRLGFVGALADGHLFIEKVYAEWRMLVCLAGRIAEERLFGESTLGSSSDQATWLEASKIYLANHHHGIYYATPQNEFEQRLNEEKLTALQEMQIAQVRVFLDENIELLRALSHALYENGKLNGDDLVPFLIKVRFQPTFPRPKLATT